MQPAGKNRGFFEKKQNLCQIWASAFPERPRPNVAKVFCFFFSKKKALLSCRNRNA
jgi:hypothetical protein